MSADLFLKNAVVVTENSTFTGGVLVSDGKVTQLVTGDVDVDAQKVIDLKGKVLLPGIVDGHVHFNEPGRTHWEGYETGSKAAAAGGVTTFFEMPLNATPPTITHELLKEKRRVVHGKPVIDYGNWGGLVDNNLDALQDMHEDGVVGYKAFLSNSGVDFERINDDLLYEGLRFSGETGNLIGLHAENEHVTALLGQQMKVAGRTDRASWYQSRPPETELEAIERSCFWAKHANGNLHILHISIAEGIHAVTKAKKEGVHVSAETCPHYLFFDHQDFERIGPSAKCAPPIRSRENVEALWALVFDGQVDVINSDHSPCEWKDKAKGMDDIWKAWGGILGVQLMLPVILTEGVNKRGLPLQAIARMMSANPARIYGLYPRKGNIMPGSDADFAVVDLNNEWTLKADDLLSRNKHSAYVGNTFTGKVTHTFVRGTLVYDDGDIIVSPGYGQLLRRESSYVF